MRIRKISNGAATNSLLLTFVQVITTILGIVVTKLMSVNFSLQEYGGYSQALLITSSATSLSILGLSNGLNYFYNRTEDPQEQKKYISTLFFIEYCFGGLACVVILVLQGVFIQYFKNDSLNTLIPIVALTPLLTNLITMYQVLFVSIGKAKIIAVRNFFVSIIRLVAVILACYLLKNIAVVLLAVLLLDFMQVVYFFVLFSKYKYPIMIKNTDFSLTKEILIFCIPMAIYIATNALSRDIDKYVISLFTDTETLAVYTNASKLLPFDMLTASLITILIPIMTRLINQKKFSEAKDVFSLYLKIGYILTFTFVGGAIAVSKELMLFLYDEKFISGLGIFIVYLFVDMIRFANVVSVLSGAGKTKVLMIISVSTMIANLIFNVFGFILFGIIGPAIVTFVLTIIMILLLLHFSAKELHTKIVCLFEFKKMFLLLLEIAIVGFGTYYLSNVFSELNIGGFINLAVSYGIYLFLIGLLNYKEIIRCFKKLNELK